MFIRRSILFSIIIVLVPVITFARPIEPGAVIANDNYQQYFPELKKMLPVSKYHWLIELGLKKGLISMPAGQTKYLPLPKGLVFATKNNKGICRIGEKNELIGWTAGYPFLEPKNALELAWNTYPDVGHGSAPDQGYFPAWFGLYGKDKFERSFDG